MNQLQNFSKGILKENPVLVLLLGLCPTLGVTTSAINGLGMGLATAFVIIFSNMAISLLSHHGGIVPNKVRIPIFIVIIASFVTIVDLLMQAYVPSLYSQLGLYIPLIVVNCIVLGRAESFASKNNLLSSAIDGLGMGVGFALALTILGAIREIIGAGTFFGLNLHLYPMSKDGDPITIVLLSLAPGAFFGLGYLIAITNKLTKKYNK